MYPVSPSPSDVTEAVTTAATGGEVVGAVLVIAVLLVIGVGTLILSHRKWDA